MIRRSVLVTGFASVLAVAAAVPAIADEFCRADPQPECLLGMAHAEAGRIADLMARARVLNTISMAEAGAGYADLSRATLAEAQLIADSGRLSETTPPMQFALPPDLELPPGVTPPPDLPARSEDSLRMEVYSGIVGAQVSANWPIDEILRSLPGGDNSQERLSLLLMAFDSLLDVDRMEDAEIVISEMKAGVERSDDPMIAASGPQMIAMMLVRSGRFDEAVAQLDRAGAAVDPLTYIRVLVGIYYQLKFENGDPAAVGVVLTMAEAKVSEIMDAEQRAMAEELLARLRPAAEPEQEEHAAAKPAGGCPADLSPAGFAIGQAELGFFEPALDLALSLPDQKERDRALTGIVRAQLKRSEPDGALETAQLLGDEMLRSFVMTEIAEALARQGNADRAWLAAQSIAEPQQRDSASSRIVPLLLEAGETGGAMRVAGKLPFPEQRADVYVALARQILADSEEGHRGEPESDAPAGEPGVTAIE